MKDFFAQVRHEQARLAANDRIEAVARTTNLLRSQLMLYKLQHRDKIPSLKQIGDGFKFLTLQTDAEGNPSTGNYSVGPYLHHPVVNPLTGKSKVVAANQPVLEAGWTYDPETGIVKAVLPRQLEPKVKDVLSARDVEYAEN